MSTLRNKMIQQMQLKGYSSRTIETYTKSIIALAVYYNKSPDLLTTEQIRQYIQYHLTEKKLSKSWLNQFISAWKILFCQVLRKEWSHLDIPRPRRERKLPVILSKEEVSQLINVTANPRNLSADFFCTCCQKGFVKSAITEYLLHETEKLC